MPPRKKSALTAMAILLVVLPRVGVACVTDVPPIVRGAVGLDCSTAGACPGVDDRGGGMKGAGFVGTDGGPSAGRA